MKYASSYPERGLYPSAYPFFFSSLIHESYVAILVFNSAMPYNFQSVSYAFMIVSDWVKYPNWDGASPISSCIPQTVKSELPVNATSIRCDVRLKEV